MFVGRRIETVLMTARDNLLTTFRALFALVAIAAITTEVVTLIERGKFEPFNFFSYFTVESNLFAAAILLLSAFAVQRGERQGWLDHLRGAAALYMLITGITFSVLLAGIEGAEFTAVPWDNFVLHYLMPIVMAVDWLIDPPAHRIEFRPALAWLAFPILYAVYSLIRGGIVGWYPYPFLDPDERGYLGVLVTSAFLIALAIGLIWLLLRIADRAANQLSD